MLPNGSNTIVIRGSHLSCNTMRNNNVIISL